MKTDDAIALHTCSTHTPDDDIDSHWRFERWDDPEGKLLLAEQRVQKRVTLLHAAWLAGAEHAVLKKLVAPLLVIAKREAASLRRRNLLEGDAHLSVAETMRALVLREERIGRGNVLDRRRALRAVYEAAAALFELV